MTKYKRRNRHWINKSNGWALACVCGDLDFSHKGLFRKSGCKSCTCEKFDWAGNYVDEWE